MRIDDLPDYPALRQVQHALWGSKEVRGAAVMIGAGFSKFSDLVAPDGRSPPLWSDFDAVMRQRLHGESLPSDPLKLAEQYSAALGRHALDALISELVCDHQWTPGALHARLLGLPWVDVLTTNWDTLLERTPLEEPDRAYEVVRIISDIARTRAPRIVKLHGSLPSHEPFIFTSEDFRTYPKQFAPFVNLAQQVLLENELCLLGFSGDDPNFLQWSGWVRDQLGASARKIRLIGVLNLSPSRRQVLERYNISPIDLAPLVADRNDQDKHRDAAKLFLDSLWTAKPRPAHVWARHRDRKPTTISTEQDAETFLLALKKNWKEDRKNYPGWLVAPPYERVRLYNETESTFPELTQSLSRVGPDLRAAIAYELIWRYDTALVPLSETNIKLAEEALANTNDILNNHQREEIQLSLLRAARRRRDWAVFDSLITSIGSRSPFASEAIAYEKALRCRDELDFSGLSACVSEVEGDDPVWKLRRAALMCELGDDEQASEVILESWNEIKSRRARDRSSIWLLSREAWAAWLLKRALWTLRNKLAAKEGEDEYDRWPVKYKAANCDPWDETTYIDHKLSERHTRQLNDLEVIQPQFDAGTYKDKSKTVHFRNETSLLYELSALADQVGLSTSIGNVEVLGNRFARCLEVTDDKSDAAVWLAVLRLRGASDGFFERYFSRIRIAQLPLPLVEAIAHRLRQTIDYGSSSLTKLEWVTRSVKCTEILSRLVVRLPADQANEVFRWAIGLANDSRWKHWWLFEPLDHLLVRSLETIPPAERQFVLLPAMQMRLPKDITGQGLFHHWPELAFKFKSSYHSSRDTSYAWTQAVASLIETVRTSQDVSRAYAAWRLVAMHDGGALTDEELKSFGSALWLQDTDQDGFPNHTQLHSHSFLRLPETTLGLAQSIFDRTVVQKLADGDLDENRLIALSGSARESGGTNAKRNIGVAVAKNILKACLNWRPKERDIRDIFTRDTNDKIGNLIGYCLTNAVLPVFSPIDLEPDEIQLWGDALKNAPVASIVRTAAQFVRLVPDREADAILSIRRSLAGHTMNGVVSGVIAVNHMIRFHADTGHSFPSALSSDIVSICSARRDPGLLMSLACARRLLIAGLIGSDDERRLAEAIELLFVETNYETWDAADPRTPSHSLIRQECVRLAHAFHQRRFSSKGVDDWLAAYINDPMPEVRFAITFDEDD